MDSSAAVLIPLVMVALALLAVLLLVVAWSQRPDRTGRPSGGRRARAAGSGRARVPAMTRSAPAATGSAGLAEMSTLVNAADLDEVRQLALRNRTIHAIKRYRELTGAGLAEAKLAVDQLRMQG